MDKNPKKSRVIAFFEELGPFLLMITLPVSFVLCLLQYLVKSQSMLFLIIASLIGGVPLLVFGFKALAYKELRNFTSFGMLILGGVLLAWAGFLIFKPTGQISTKTRMLLETRSKAVDADEILVFLDISPTTYLPGDRGLIYIQVQNNTDKKLTLDSVMFETKKKFFDGFIVDYESAVPKISERKEKLGMSIALFFGEEQTKILPGQTAEFEVEIVANIPGDYAADYYAVLMVGLNSEAMPRRIPEITKEIFLVIQPED